MSFSTILKLLLSIFQAIPLLKSFWDGLIAAYIEAQIAEMKIENREAIRKAFDEFDQRHIEEALNSPRAGLPSGEIGTELRDSLPGVGVQNANP